MDELTENKRRKFTRKILFIMMALLLLAITAAFVISNKTDETPVAPELRKVRESVDFPVYFPDKRKMPAGYRLDQTSFTKPRQNVLIYAITSKSGNKIFVSVQKKPLEAEIQKFYQSYIPLRIDFQTSLGKAELGATNPPKANTIVSLPTHQGSWIICTAPADINQEELKQVVRSLKI